MSNNESTIPQVIKGVPNYVFSYVVGFLLAIISDTTLTSLLIGSVAVSIAFTPAIGVATFFLFHTVIRMVNALTSATVSSARLQSQGSHHIAQVLSPPPGEVRLIEDTDSEV